MLARCNVRSVAASSQGAHVIRATWRSGVAGQVRVAMPRSAQSAIATNKLDWRFAFVPRVRPSRSLKPRSGRVSLPLHSRRVESSLVDGQTAISTSTSTQFRTKAWRPLAPHPPSATASPFSISISTHQQKTPLVQHRLRGHGVADHKRRPCQEEAIGLQNQNPAMPSLSAAVRPPGA